MVEVRNETTDTSDLGLRIDGQDRGELGGKRKERLPDGAHHIAVFDPAAAGGTVVNACSWSLTASSAAGQPDSLAVAGAAPTTGPDGTPFTLTCR